MLIERMGARTYLEIGVHRGWTFNQVVAPHRTGVDPDFWFDVTSIADERTRLIESASDDFFASLPVDATFDVVFLDGLHTFEQTYRDLCNAILHSHHRSVILIDDTVPSDVYSSLPEEGRALRFRARGGGSGQAWHGDTYKVVFAIHDFHPGLAYRTIRGSGNPQTLVWRSKQLPRRPRFGSLEAITRLTYFDAMDSIEAFHDASEAPAIEMCIDDVTSEWR